MSTHVATVTWARGTQPFVDNRYSRRHELRFDGGQVVPGSSSPHVVKVPFSDPAAVDPEEAFVASLAACHMLWFLSLAAAAGWCVDHYTDHAEGLMRPDTDGKPWLATVTLRPAVRYAGDAQPTRAEEEALHHAAHAECFLARSVRSEVRCEPVRAA